jgi:hypothetical protein
MSTLKAVSLAVDLLTAVTELTGKLQVVSGILQRAHAEGREVSEDEMNEVVAMDDAARERLGKLLGG